MTTEDEQPRDPMGSDSVGSVGEEAAKLLGVLSGWAKAHGSDLGQGLSDVGAGAASALKDLDDHIATGAPECTYCPVCRVVHVVRESSPEVRHNLTVAGVALMQAAAGLLATTLPDEPERRDRAGDVEHIDLDDEWPEDQ